MGGEHRGTGGFIMHVSTGMGLLASGIGLVASGSAVAGATGYLWGSEHDRDAAGGADPASHHVAKLVGGGGSLLFAGLATVSGMGLLGTTLPVGGVGAGAARAGLVGVAAGGILGAALLGARLAGD